MADFILIAVILLVLGIAIFYIVKAKKSGQKCIGCPSSKTCSQHCCHNTTTGCSCQK